MLTRLTLIAGMTWTVACATQRATPQLLPEPTFVETEIEVETGAAPAQVDHGPPAPADGVANPEIRDVVYTEPGELPQMLHAGVAFPLRRTDVRAELRGDAAEVTVKQRFVNDGDAALEAIYTFPLPENSAVDGVSSTTSDFSIVPVRSYASGDLDYKAPEPRPRDQSVIPGSADEAINTCLKDHLGAFARAARSPGARLELVLVVWMQY